MTGSDIEATIDTCRKGRLCFFISESFFIKVSFLISLVTGVDGEGGRGQIMRGLLLQFGLTCHLYCHSLQGLDIQTLTGVRTSLEIHTGETAGGTIRH